MFEPELRFDELARTFRNLAETFRDVDGLVQTFSLHDESLGRGGAFDVFDSETSRDAFFASDLRATIGEA